MHRHEVDLRTAQRLYGLRVAGADHVDHLATGRLERRCHHSSTEAGSDDPYSHPSLVHRVILVRKLVSRQRGDRELAWQRRSVRAIMNR